MSLTDVGQKWRIERVSINDQLRSPAALYYGSGQGDRDSGTALASAQRILSTIIFLYFLYWQPFISLRPHRVAFFLEGVRTAASN